KITEASPPFTKRSILALGNVSDISCTNGVINNILPSLRLGLDIRIRLISKESPGLIVSGMEYPMFFVRPRIMARLNTFIFLKRFMDPNSYGIPIVKYWSTGYAKAKVGDSKRGGC